MASIQKRPDRPKPWKVAWSESGKRRARHFRTRREAELFVASIRVEESLPDLAVTTEERMVIARLRSLAFAAGVTLDEVAAAAVEMAHARQVKPVAIANAIRAYLDDCDRRGLRPATLLHYRGCLHRFERAHNGHVRDLSRAQVRDWLVSSYQREESRRTTRTPVMAWLRWCARQGWADPERWRDAVTWDAVRQDAPEIGILTPEQLRATLDALPEYLRVTLAIAAFTGIRPRGELERLRWEHLDASAELIRIPASISKTRMERVLYDLPSVVWQWIQWERQRTEQAGKRRGYGRVAHVMPIGYRHYQAGVKRACPVSWPRDGTRHSFASYGYHVLGLDRTVEAMGHIGGYRLFQRRYKKAASVETANEWFAVRP